jgi:hypothetical protein
MQTLLARAGELIEQPPSSASALERPADLVIVVIVIVVGIPVARATNAP